MPTALITVQEEVDMRELKDVHVWTPSGEEVWSGWVAKKKAWLAGGQQWQAIRYAKQQGGFVPSSGLWHQIVSKIEDMDLEEDTNLRPYDFLSGRTEDTATLLMPLRRKGGYADGLVIQYPLLNVHGTNYLRDEKGIPKGRQVWQMAFPAEYIPLEEMPKKLDTFLNLIYGMPEAREQLAARDRRDNVFPRAFIEVDLDSSPDQIRARRSSWVRGWAYPSYRRVGVDCSYSPADKFKYGGTAFHVLKGGEDSVREVALY